MNLHKWLSVLTNDVCFLSLNHMSKATTEDIEFRKSALNVNNNSCSSSESYTFIYSRCTSITSLLRCQLVIKRIMYINVHTASDTHAAHTAVCSDWSNVLSIQTIKASFCTFCCKSHSWSNSKLRFTTEQVKPTVLQHRKHTIFMSEQHHKNLYIMSSTTSIPCKQCTPIPSRW